jgi:asparagine synthetase B (glutamine-hydrolysing)
LHARLSIIDPEGGRSHVERRWKALDYLQREIFNYVELREELIQKGHQLPPGLIPK